MSGFPNLPDIELLRAVLATINKERATIDRLGSKLSTIMIASKQLRIDFTWQRRR